MDLPPTAPSQRLLGTPKGLPDTVLSFGLGVLECITANKSVHNRTSSLSGVLGRISIPSPAQWVKDLEFGVSIVAQWVKNPTSIHEDEGLIPQWVNDLVVPRAAM